LRIVGGKERTKLFIYVTTKYTYDKHVGIAIHYHYMFRHAGVVKRLYGCAYA